MKNFINLLNELSTRNFNMQEKDGETIWSQTERNNIRNQLITAIQTDLESLFNNSELANKGLECRRTLDGVSINVPNDEWGSFVFSIAPKMHELNYDIEDEAMFFQEKQEKKNKKVN